MSTRTTAEQVNPAGALLAMVTAFSHLPAPALRVELLPPASGTGEFVWGVYVGLHDSLNHFEQWRAALGLDPAGVEAHLDGDTNWLRAFGTWSGVRVHLTGFFRFADPDPAR